MTEHHYRTKAGSTVRIFGKRGGCYEITFDWLEEDVDIDAHVSWDFDERAIRWEHNDEIELIECEEAPACASP